MRFPTIQVLRSRSFALYLVILCLGVLLALPAGAQSRPDDMFGDLRGADTTGRTPVTAGNAGPSELRRCLAVQRYLAGAIEMYNLDKNLRVEKLDLQLLETLVKEGYLVRVPEDPGQGRGSAGHYKLTSEGNGIACTVHGNGERPRATAAEKMSCFANQRTLAGALEMYSLDANVKVEKLDAALIEKLVRDGYLARVPEDPGQGPGSAKNYRFTPDGNGVTCAVHGSIGN